VKPANRKQKEVANPADCDCRGGGCEAGGGRRGPSTRIRSGLGGEKEYYRTAITLAYASRRKNVPVSTRRAGLALQGSGPDRAGCDLYREHVGATVHDVSM